MEKEKLAQAFLAAQKEIGAALKTGENPYFKSNYATLEEVIAAVKGPLNKHDITFQQRVNYEMENGNMAIYIKTILRHSSGQYDSSCTPVLCTKPNDPQAMGSGITYAKRYALQSFCGLPSADDDGNAASVPAPQEKLPPIVKNNTPYDTFSKMYKARCKALNIEQPKSKKEVNYIIDACMVKHSGEINEIIMGNNFEMPLPGMAIDCTGWYVLKDLLQGLPPEGFGAIAADAAENMKGKK